MDNISPTTHSPVDTSHAGAGDAMRSEVNQSKSQIALQYEACKDGTVAFFPERCPKSGNAANFLPDFQIKKNS